MKITTQEEDKLVDWCQINGLLPASASCPRCAHPMALKRNKKAWRCDRKLCRGQEIGIRTGTIFYRSRLPLYKLVRLLFFFAAEIPVVKAAQFAKVSTTTSTLWYGLCRDVCSKEIMPCEMVVSFKFISVFHTILLLCLFCR